MKVYADADASPVISILETLCREEGIPLILVKNYNHHITSDYAHIVTVDVGADSADYYIANHASPGDIVVTGDYGLSAMALSKNAKVINNYGEIIDAFNIDSKLARRHINRLQRKKGIYTKFKGRTSAEDGAFARGFRQLLEENPHHG